MWYRSACVFRSVVAKVTSKMFRRRICVSTGSISTSIIHCPDCSRYIALPSSGCCKIISILRRTTNAPTGSVFSIRFGIFLAVLLFVCLFVIINTISLAVYARRNEIIVMRYVGAARWFIATPFVLEGVIIGLVASGLAFFIEGQIYMYITSMITGELGLIKLIPYSELRDLMLYSFLGVGVLTGVVGSILSLRKRVEA